MSVNPTWEDRDLPVLRAALEVVEAKGDDHIGPKQIMRASGFDEATVQASLRALDQGQPPFFSKITRVASGDAIIVQSPTERARRAVGLWPTPYDLADRFIAAYEEAAEEAESEEQRSTYRRVAQLARDTGRGVLVEVMSKVLTGS